ncbi:hypothetical protein BDN67DRAFT_965704 [Paxillus ammoniavirescens]|nr:hypothetical protein BDN67DRAFT_965704 [Paxillus ammoniavirescens]
MLYHPEVTSTILLIVQTARVALTGDNAKPQVITKAIAAFQMNNLKRTHPGKEMKDSISIPCITMVSTRPTFYVVPLSVKLWREAITLKSRPNSECVQWSEEGG